MSLTAPNGTFGLLGPEGAGKSSPVRTIATLQEPDASSSTPSIIPPYLANVQVMAAQQWLLSRTCPTRSPYWQKLARVAPR